METIQAYVTLLKDILTGLAALTATVIVIIGLQTWKKQLRGKTEYELAQRLLQTTYKVRDVVRETIIFFLGEEIVPPSLSTKKEYSKTIDDIAYAEVIDFMHSRKPLYENKWQEVKEASAQLDGVLLEAEAIWGLAAKRFLNHFKNFLFFYLHLLQLT